MTTKLPFGNKYYVPVTPENKTYTCYNCTHCILPESHKWIVTSPQSQAHTVCVLFTLYTWVAMCTHIPSQEKDNSWLLSFLTKASMSFNIITGLTRTDFLCLLLCAAPRWEGHRGVFVQSLMTTAHPFHDNPFISIHSWERDKEAETWMFMCMRCGEVMRNERGKQRWQRWY